MDTFIYFPQWPTLRVVGPDAAPWLNGLVTCDVLSVGPGKAAWGTLLTKQGKIAGELQITGDKEELFIAVSGGDAESILQTLDGYLVMEDAEIEAIDRRWAVFGEGTKEKFVERGLGPSLLPWSDALVFAAQGTSEQMEAIASISEQPVFGEEEWDTWRLGQGVPRFGVDYSEKDNLHAASLERRTVDWQKGCYLGQEVVCMQDMRGKVKKRLVLLRTEGGKIGAGTDLTSEKGDTVGQVTSSAGAVAIGSVTAPHFETGTALESQGLKVRVEPLRV